MNNFFLNLFVLANIVKMTTAELDENAISDNPDTPLWVALVLASVAIGFGALVCYHNGCCSCCKRTAERNADNDPERGRELQESSSLLQARP